MHDNMYKYHGQIEIKNLSTDMRAWMQARSLGMCIGGSECQSQVTSPKT